MKGAIIWRLYRMEERERCTLLDECFPGWMREKVV